MAQRLRITFARGGTAIYLSHLEMMRMWERVFRRAGWRPAYSHGFNPHPRISFASALAVGVAAEAELLDVELETPRPLDDAVQELAGRMPPGTAVREVREVPTDEPALQSRLVAACYRVALPQGADPEGVEREVRRALAAESLPRERAKESKTVRYDLRPLIRDLVLEQAEGAPAIRMELRADARGAGRPDELLRELGLDPAECRITRARLVLDGERPTGDRKG